MSAIRILVAALVCLALALAASALAAGPKLTPGKYGGTTGQRFSITFRITKRTISAVDTTTRDRCSDGTSLEVPQDAFTSGRLDRKDRFTLRAGPRRQQAVIKGRVKGAKASGTI